MSHRELTSSAYNHRARYNRLAYFNHLFNSVRWSSICVFLFPALQEIRIRMLYANWWRPITGWRTSDALIPYVEVEAISAEVQATSLMMMNLCRSRNKIHRYGEREREISTKDVMYYVNNNNYNVQPTLTKGYLVTLYSDLLRATVLYTIYRNSPNLGGTKGQYEYGHYTLVFDRISLLNRLLCLFY